ncbi:conserved hypothetical protein [Ricinus communis]|uniref:Uncharacterized protein n=1 Tax=Ricinus communis TaxID=3988 RepID=B9TMP2_RICCO|nr:conserved hypothetical protein [Ricinus communis]
MAGAIATGDALQFAAGGEYGAVVAAPGQAAIAEEAPAERDATHVEAFELQRLAATEHELRRPAADIDHQPGFVAGREIARDPLIDQTRFFDAADHVDWHAEAFFSAAEELVAILGGAQRVGTDHAHPRRRQLAQALAEALKRGDGLVHHDPAKRAIGQQAGADPDRFLEAVDHHQLAALEAREQQMKTVRAEIERGIDLARGAG